MTSKGNSYGIGRYVWFDGEEAKGRVEAGYAHRINITDVINTRFIQHCSPDSFFEILAKEYISTNLTKYSPSYRLILPNGTEENRKCDDTEMCLPISLPSDFSLYHTSTHWAALGLFVGLSFMDINNLAVDLSIKLIAYKLKRSKEIEYENTAERFVY